LTVFDTFFPIPIVLAVGEKPGQTEHEGPAFSGRQGKTDEKTGYVGLILFGD
jgi:hypothetical protein